MAYEQSPLSSPKLGKRGKTIQLPSKSLRKRLVQISILISSEKKTLKGPERPFAIFTHKLGKELSTQ